MLPPRARLDPDGYYQRLGVAPAAAQADVVSAFRRKARLLHPDVPRTGNAAAFVALKQAYDVLGNQDRRADYDRRAEALADQVTRPAADTRASSPPVDNFDLEPEAIIMRRPAAAWSGALRRATARASRYLPEPFQVPMLVWVGLGAFLCLSLYQVAAHLRAPSRTALDDIRPNAPMVMPLPPRAHLAMLYGATPIRLAGVPNFYVQPAATAAVLLRPNRQRNALVPVGQLPPFSSVQVVRLIRASGLLEVLVDEHGTGFIGADHLAPGNAAAARRAYCGYNAGPAPYDGELLERRGHGSGKLAVENHSVQPAVVKLRDAAGEVILSVFLGPAGRGVFDDLPAGIYHADFAIGELWSRACNSFAAGMRARRMVEAFSVPGPSPLVVAPDAAEAAAADIPDQVFERE